MLKVRYEKEKEEYMVCTKDSNNKVCVGRTNLAGDILATFQSEHEGIGYFLLSATDGNSLYGCV